MWKCEECGPDSYRDVEIGRDFSTKYLVQRRKIGGKNDVICGKLEMCEHSYLFGVHKRLK